VRVLDPAADVLAGERRRRAERRARTRSGSTGSDAIASPMQGTVLRVEVREGEAVEPGRVLVIVEAMKMENEIAAVRRGVVADVRVAPGDAVRSGQVLLSVVDAA
jgi:acetyl-CoA/propionyl-CoA carboxylase biotin carboxyl carrier protein